MRPLLALFVRALRETNRARSTYLLRGGVAALTLVFLWLTHRELSWMGAAGLRFFAILVVGNYFFVTLLGLGSFASAIAEEKEEGTLGLMRMANLSPLAILFGKSTSRLATVLLLLLVQLPFAFLAVTMGGVSQTQVLLAFILLASYLFALANVSVFFSVLLPRSSRAAAMTMALLFGVTISFAFLEGIKEWLIYRKSYSLTDPLIVGLKSWGDWAWSVHPVSHCYTLASGGYLSLEPVRSVLVHLGIGGAFFAMSLLIFERFCGNEEAYSRERGRRIRRWRWLGRPKRAGIRAFAWKDFHFAMGGRLSVGIRLLLYMAAVWLLVWVNYQDLGRQNLQRRQIADVALGFGWIMLHVELAVLSLLMWGPEAWGQKIGSVIATPRALTRINYEKVRAILLAALPSVLMIVGAFVVGGPEFTQSTLGFDVSQYRPGGMPYPLWRVLTIFKWLSQFGVLLALTVNLSLRLRWTALPAAIGIFGVAQFLHLALSLRSTFSRFGRNAIVLDATVVIGTCVLLIFLLSRNTHTLLLRRAAEG